MTFSGARETADDAWSRHEEHHGEPAEPLYVVNPAKWQGLLVPERRWIVPSWIPFGVATGLYGPPGHGKTLIMQQLMTARALSKPWLGQSASHGKSIAFLCEDDEDELHRRQEAINRHYGCEFSDLRDFIRFVPRLGYDNVMMTFKDGRPVRTPFFDQVLSESLSFGADLALVDTVADTFGGDQNNMGHARQFVQGFAAIARAIKGAVLAAAHPSQHGKTTGTGESGSVQWDAAFRSRGYLDTPKIDAGETPDDDARILSRVKANYARKGETIPLRWEDGVFISTAPQAGILGSIERKKCERVFGDLLDRLASEGQRVSHNSRAANYAPKIFALRPDREGYKRADFERAMHNLLSQKIIKIATYKDIYRNEHECIVRMPVAAGDAPTSRDKHDVLDQIFTAIDRGLPPNGEHYSADAASDSAAWRVVTAHQPEHNSTEAQNMVMKWIKDGIVLQDNGGLRLAPLVKQMRRIDQ